MPACPTQRLSFIEEAFKCFHLNYLEHPKICTQLACITPQNQLVKNVISGCMSQVKLLEGTGSSFGHTSVAEFLDKAVEPPPSVSVQNAVRLLQDIGAFEAPGERLTLLGRHLAALPLPPRIGKMLLYGVLFACLDPILTISCCMAYRCACGGT